MPLLDSSPEKWEYKVHTGVKHEILKKYLSVWIRHLGKLGKICYFDCFAGRGKYTGGQPCSPIIVMRLASENSKYFKEFVCLFVEKDSDNFKDLVESIDEELKNNERYEKIKVLPPANDEFANVASSILKKVGDKLAPSFFFIDPFGFSGVPFSIIKDILSIKRTEVFITLMTRDINRFLSDPNKSNILNELFGTEKWKEIAKIEDPKERENKLRDLYVQQLEGHAEHIRSYRVNMDEIRQTVYYLIHATNHFKGFKLMTEIMYRESTSGGMFAYLGPNEGQLRLQDFSSDMIIKTLKNLILEQFLGRSISFWDIMKKSFHISGCIERQYRQAIKELEGEGKVKIDRQPPVTSTGKERTGLGESDIIIFPKKLVKVV